MFAGIDMKFPGGGAWMLRIRNPERFPKVEQGFEPNHRLSGFNEIKLVQI